MDIGQLFTNAGSMLWHRRLLWLFGFVGVAGTVVIDAGMRLWLRPELIERLADSTLPALPGPAGILAIILLVFAFALLLWLLNVFAEGSLIFAVSEFDAGRTVTGRATLRTVKGIVGPFIAVDTLLFLPLFLLALSFILAGTALFVAFIYGVNEGFLDTQQGLSLLAGGFLACLLPILLLVIPVLLVTHILRLLAFRAVAIDKAGVWESIRLAGRFLRRRPGIVLLVAMLLWVLRFMANTLTSLFITPLDLVSWRPLFQLFNNEVVSTQSTPVVVISGLVISLISILTATFLYSYAATVWTLVYQQEKRA